MTPDALKKELVRQLIPSEYQKVVENGVPESWLVLRKFSHAFACVPFSEVQPNDFKNSHIKRTLRKALRALPVILEKGVFILYYGDQAEWESCREKFKVDKTALRPIIVQSVHFLDLNSGDNFNKSTAWGPIKFGFCKSTIDKIEAMGNSIKESI